VCFILISNKRNGLGGVVGIMLVFVCVFVWCGSVGVVGLWVVWVVFWCTHVQEGIMPAEDEGGSASGVGALSGHYVGVIAGIVWLLRAISWWCGPLTDRHVRVPVSLC
jgi:hypothetical protein